ncbi:hypothetical protein FACS1894211_09900 [Clostridia bacterium]|nr:hypothetical protein FACS1894211_09900 [Clostridia bacterium]
MILKNENIVLRTGAGGFAEDGTFIVDGRPAAPHSNVIACGDFGTLVTDTGGGFTWYKNARENKLTVWRSDAAHDEPSESFTLQKEGCKPFSIGWPAENRSGSDGHIRTVSHGFGESVFTCGTEDAEFTMRVYIGRAAEVKYYDLTARGKRPAGFALCVRIEPVLGDFEPYTARYIRIERDGNEISARNTANGSALFFGLAAGLQWTRERETDGKKDIAYAARFGLKQHETKRFIFCLSPHGGKAQLEGSGQWSVVSGQLKDDDKGQIKDKNSNCALKNADAAREDCINYFSNLSRLKIQTPDPAFDMLLKWLPYQTLCGRFFGRTGYYQAGGAWGFRDQLQDCLALLYVDPALVRNHILLCARHQFKEGDAQHWWHPDRTGVRTRMTDDLLFLPYAVAEYITFTGDRGILDAEEPFLDAPELQDGARGDYSAPPYTAYTASLYEHCLRALRRALKFGERGLNLIGGGDWNDAFDEIGIGGCGESVWLTAFFYLVVDKFLPYVKEPKARRELFDLKAILKKNVSEKAWDGRWFVRAYFDDGTPVGSVKSEEGKIDLIAGSFAVLTGIADGERTERILDAIREYLVDTRTGIVKLLTPPFTASGKRAGYINDYPPGIRENGGQYTHAAVWYALALIKAGKKDEAYKILSMINPVNRGKDAAYRGEPYVTAADVYSANGLEGRAGWTWYTGSAAWMYKAMIEGVLGIRIEGNRLHVQPNAPKEWKEFRFGWGGKVKVTVKLNSQCTIHNAQLKDDNKGQETRDRGQVKDKTAPRIYIDGVLQGNDYIVIGDGAKEVVVEI